MKNLKTGFVLVAICATLFTSCEKDDENTSSPGYFIVDGKKYDLATAFYDYAPENEYKGVKYIQHGVTFLGEDMPTNEEDISSGSSPIKGAMAIFQCMDPLKMKIPVQGEYSFQSDIFAPKAYTYFDFFIAYSSDYREMNDTTKTKYFSIKEIVEVKNEGEIYEFSSSGKTSEGKTFEFHYKGIFSPYPEN